MCVCGAPSLAVVLIECTKRCTGLSVPASWSCLGQPAPAQLCSAPLDREIPLVEPVLIDTGGPPTVTSAPLSRGMGRCLEGGGGGAQWGVTATKKKRKKLK